MPSSAPRCFGLRPKSFKVLIDGRRHENSVHGALMAPDQWPELTRQGKGHHEYSTGSNLARCRSSHWLASWFWH
jgi:hypothetical protein